MKGIGAKKANFLYLELVRDEPPRIIRFHSYCLATQSEVDVFQFWKKFSPPTQTFFGLVTQSSTNVENCVTSPKTAA